MAKNLPITLQPGERVVLLLKRHWLYAYPQLALNALVAILPVLVLLYFTTHMVAIVVAVVWGVFWAVRIYFLWYRYENDLWFVTNQRVVDSVRRHWFHHKMASADLVDVEDIQVERNGFFSTVFNYGSVRLQTAGQQANFTLSGIPAPADVLSQIDSGRDTARREAISRQSWS